jgi:hypothetical protein
MTLLKIWKPQKSQDGELFTYPQEQTSKKSC